jgi:hypothetical protein
MSLRPIGTEFWHEFPVCDSDSRGVQDRFLYRVKGHEKAHMGGPNTPLQDAEAVDVVGHQTRPIIGMHSVQLSDRTIWDYDFGEWSDAKEKL